MHRKARIGIIGMGMMGTIHAKEFQAVPGAEVAAVCDTRPDVLHARADEFGVEQRYADYRKMLRDPNLDAAIIGTPNFTHCKIALDAFKAGKHVLCEKPMALNASQARRMTTAAKKARKVLQMGMIWRHKAECRVAKEMIEKGILGRIYHIHLVLRRRRGIPGLGRWFTTKALSGGGVLVDIGVHFFDLVMWLTNNWNPVRAGASLHSEFGSPLRRYVFTSMWAGPPNYKGTFDVDDYATGIVRFPQNVTLTFEFSWAANCRPEDSVDVLGNKGGMRLCDGDGLKLFTEYNGRVADVRPQYEDASPSEVQARSFVAAIRGKRKPAATGEEGLTVMKLLDAIDKSSRLNREVAIRPE